MVKNLETFHFPYDDVPEYKNYINIPHFLKSKYRLRKYHQNNLHLHFFALNLEFTNK